MTGFGGTVAGGGAVLGCPAWCRGCGPDDPLHRSELTTIGREGTGWMSVQLIVDRFLGRGPMLRVDTTRYGSTQTALLSDAQASRLIAVLTRGRDTMTGCGLPGVAELVESSVGWPYAELDRLEPGVRLLIFGGLVDLLGVEPVPAFPTARLLHVRAVPDGRRFTVVAPADLRPLVVDR